MAEQRETVVPQVQIVQALAGQIPQDFWQIVVAGAMDPRQHHPFWYKTIGCLTENDAAKISGVIYPALSHFAAPDFSITCTPERWTIQALSRDKLPKIRLTASKVFQKLSEVPVAAFGINAALHSETKAASVKLVLSRLLIEDRLGFPEDGDTDTSITFVNKTDPLTTTVVVGQSPKGDNFVFTGHDSHHPIKGAEGYFDLDLVIRDHADKDWTAADAFNKKVVTRIDELAKD